MAAKMSVLVVKSIKSELNISVDSVTYWADTMCVLHYIKKSRLKASFIRCESGQENTRVHDARAVKLYTH